jgi:hypothetical protein
LVVGEVGIQASDAGSGCGSRSNRARVMTAKLRAQLSAGVAGFLPWDYMPTDDHSCNYETITADDPLMAVLRTTAL